MKKLKRLMGLLVPYAICVLIPFLAVIGMAGIISGLYRGQIVENREEIVKNAFEDVLDKISAVEEVGSYLKGNERINQYAVANLLGNGNSYAEYMEMQEMFTDLMKGRPIQGITLSDFKNNRIMTDVGMTSNIRRYYNSVYKLEGLSTDEMQARYREVPILPKWHGTVDALSNKKHLKLIEYTMQVPETYLTYYPMTLTIKVNAEVLFEELEEVLAEGDEIFIYNVDKEEENLVWSKGTRYTEMPWAETEGALLKMSGNGASNMWEMKLSSEDGAWMARIYLSNVLESMFSGEMITVLMVIMLVLLISFAVCIYFTFYNYRNIQSLMKLMSETEEENETYDSTYGYQTLQEPIKRLVDEKNRVQKKADDIKWKNMAESLFLGNADREKDREAVETLGLKDAAVRVLCLRYIDSDYRKYFSGGDISVKEFVGLYIKNLCGEQKTEIFEGSARENIFVFYDTELVEREQAVRELIEKLNIEVFLPNDITVWFGVGNSVESIYEISNSFRQAKDIIEYRKLTGKSILFYSEIEQFSEYYHYPAEFDKLFLAYIAEGKAEGAKAFLRNMYEENVNSASNRLSLEALKRMKAHIVNNIVMMGNYYKIPVDAIIQRINRQENLQDFFEYAYGLIDMISASADSEKAASQEDIVTVVMEYIEDNYSDTSLSLDSIAADLGFSKDYISKTFKSKYGENLFAVVEKLRMDKACSYLKNTDKKIAEVALLVGYNSDLSFRRAFKKVKGITPSDYRN